MSKAMGLLKSRVFNKEFESRAKAHVVLRDVFPITNDDSLRLVFESVNSTWRQGVWLGCQGDLEIAGSIGSSMDIWHDNAPTIVEVRCPGQNDGLLRVYNIWDSGRGFQRESQKASSGMLVEELENGRRYRCNDLGFETAFDKLVFRIERMLH